MVPKTHIQGEKWLWYCTPAISHNKQEQFAFQASPNTLGGQQHLHTNFEHSFTE